MKLKPKRIAIDCCFQCPECGYENWLTLKEIRAIGKYVCFCGKVLCVEYSKKNKKKKKCSHSTSDLSHFVKTLCDLGFKKSDAQQRIANTEYNGNDEEFLRNLLQ
jgi:Holliday junction resolvasome RuvABC DNA-binding subunit